MNKVSTFIKILINLNSIYLKINYLFILEPNKVE
jgi:hypothetical protein